MRKPSTVAAAILAMGAVVIGVLVGCGQASSARTEPRIYQQNVQLDDGRTIVCIVFDNTSYEGDMLTCDWK